LTAERDITLGRQHHLVAEAVDEAKLLFVVDGAGLYGRLFAEGKRMRKHWQYCYHASQAQAEDTKLSTWGPNEDGVRSVRTIDAGGWPRIRQRGL